MDIQENVNLADYTSLHVGGTARRLVKLNAQSDIAQVIKDAQSHGPIWILGYGTNVLISDQGLPGSVIINHGGKLEVNGTQIKVDSGYLWDEMISSTIDHNLWGLEFTSGIPGGVGAAIAGNIAAYGHKVADRLKEASILDTQTGQVEVWPAERFNFDYRSSSLQSAANANKIVLDATFVLSNKPTSELEYDSALKAASDLGIKPDSLANRRKIIFEARKRAGSLLDDTASGPWTAGSFFKNPLVNQDQVNQIIKHDESGISPDQLLRQNQIHGQDQARVSAAHVLLAAGFKRGQTWGNVRLHPQHVLKVENAGNATAQEIYNVVQEIVKTVQEKLSITLEPEVRFLGKF